MTHPDAPLPIAGPTAGEFAAIARMASQDAGIVIAQGKTSMVLSRLSARLRATAQPGFGPYLDFVQSKAGQSERRAMVAALTTNVTHFFREMHHFDALRRSVLPPLIERARGGGRVRLWSAGCSTGQEAFSIAMTLFDLAPDAADLDIRILATDIDPGVITDAQTGLFDVAAAASIPPAIRQRFTDRVPDGLRIAQPLRSVIRFRELNLLSPWPMRGHFDVIFCRNVVIYFAPATQAALWPRLAAATGPEGWLFVGHSERVPTGPGSPFSSAGITTYRMRGGTVPVMPTEKDTVASWR